MVKKRLKMKSFYPPDIKHNKRTRSDDDDDDNDQPRRRRDTKED
jgi:hypothetical protein